MSILVNCQACNSQFRVDDQYAGKKIRCPRCQGVASVGAVEKSVVPERPISAKTSDAPPKAASRPVRASSPPPGPAGRPAGQTQRVADYESYEDYGSTQPQSRYDGQRPRNRKSSRNNSGSLWKPLAGAAVGVIVIGIGGFFLLKALQNDPSGAVVVDNSAATSSISGSSPSLPDTNPTSPDPDVSSAAPVSSAWTDPAATTLPTVVPPSTTMPAAPAIAPNTPLPNSPAAVFAGGPLNPAQPVVGGQPAQPTMPVPGADSTVSDSVPGSAVSGGSLATDASVLAATDQEAPIEDLFARVEQSIVRVNVAYLDGTGNGSGFVIHSSGIVITNYHVIANATKAWVEFSNKERIEVDGFLYLDHRKDIAVLKFDSARKQSPLKSLPLAAAFPRKGVSVVAIGAPLGLDMSVTEGVVSAVRTTEELQTTIGLQGHDGTWVQTTAAISPGNSGGPLMNKRGEVVAINTLTYAGDNAQALNFGISSLDIGQAMGQLRSAPMSVSPVNAPKREITGEIDRSPGEDVLDVSGTPEGQKRLAALKKLTIVFLPLTFEDPHEIVIGSVRSEARQVLKRLNIEENLISNEKAALLILMKLDNAGDRLTLFVTAHILVGDESSGRPQMMKLWERTGEVGTTTRQALYVGNMSSSLKKKITEFFSRLRSDVLAARKSLNSTDGTK